MLDDSHAAADGRVRGTEAGGRDHLPAPLPQRRNGSMKTLTKKQLFEILDQVPDETPVYINVELKDVDLAKRVAARRRDPAAARPPRRPFG